ncbi:MAG: hypothetical protein KAH23_06485, partial [Kiritimatiellae bacterium]|nr:hypothetical protein [Kiritimatiellia bacterium]
ILVLIFFVFSSSAYADSSIPYVEFFEDKSAGSDVDGWHGLSASAASATFLDGVYIEGSQAMGVSSGEVALTINDADLTLSNAWCHLYAKPVLQSVTPGSTLAATNAAAFCVKDDGTLLAYSTNEWTDVGTVPTNEWIGFAVHLDYASSNWDLYVDTNNSYSAVSRRFTKMNAVPLGFNVLATNKTQLVQVVVTNGSTTPTYVDALAVSVAYTNCAAGLAKVIGVDRLANQSQMIAVPPYVYADTSLKAGEQLALDLSRGLDGVNNTAALADQLKIYYTNGWNLYNLDANTNWQLCAGDIATDDIDISLIAGMWLTRKGTKDVVVLYPYSAAPSAGNYTNMLYASNHPDKAGWNMLVWPSVYKSRSLSALTNLNPENETGTQIRIYENGRYRRFWWYDAGGAWYEGRNPVSYELKPGQAFWYYRNQESDKTWTVSSD